MIKRIFVLTIFIAVLILSANSFTIGFYNPDQATRAQGLADAFVAQADDPSALFYNPAGIVQLPGTQILVGCHLVWPTTEYQSSAGLEEETESKIYLLPHFYLTTGIGETNFTAGIGISSPFGLGTDWGEATVARFIGSNSELQLININPTIAYKINEGLSVGIGIDYYNANLTLERDNDLGTLVGMPGIAISPSELDIDGDGWGWNVGLLYKISEQHSVGASYRSKIDLDMSGDLDISNIPPQLGVGTTLSSGASSTLDLPALLKIGYAYKPIEKLKIEFDVDWLQWSRFEKMILAIDNPMLPDETTVRNWDDSTVYALGAEYRLNDKWRLRGGVGYADSPIPEETYDPIIPRNDLFIVSVGAGYAKRNFQIDFAYTAVIAEEREIDNDVGAPFLTVDGTYDSFASILGASITYKF